MTEIREEGDISPGVGAGQSISMNDNQDADKSEEVQDIIDRMPTRWTERISLLTALLILGIIALGFIIKYPDTVDGQISVTAHAAPVRLVANTSGKMYLLRESGDYLCKGDVIAYIESGADYRDILYLDSTLRSTGFENTGMDSLPGDLILGDVGTAYNSFMVAYAQYKLLIQSDIYETMRRNLTGKIALDEQIVVNMVREIELKKQAVDSAYAQLDRDSLLVIQNALSVAEYQQQRNNCLVLEEAVLTLQNNRLAKQSEIAQNRLEIQRITLEENETRAKTFAEVNTARNALENAVNVWKERYLQYAPIDGELEYLGFWRENSFVNSGQELFTVIPDKGDFFGEIKIPAQGAGKVEVGQQANVKLLKYPYDEYGYLRGKVSSISRITNNINTENGITPTYLVTVSFPDGMTTNFGRRLPLDFETQGQVEIITKRKRLIERLFDNLKAKAEK